MKLEKQPNAAEIGWVLGNRTLAYKQTSFNDLITRRYSKGFWERVGADTFEYVTLNKNGEFTVGSISGSPMIFQAGASGCSTTPTRGLSFGTDSVSGNKAHISVSFCETDLLATCFESDYTWHPNGELRLDKSVITKLTKIILDQITSGLFLALISGSVYGGDEAKTKNGGTVETTKLFIQTVDAHVGLTKMLSDNVGKFKNFNVQGLYKETDQDGRRFKGSVVDIFDALTRQAEKDDLEIASTISDDPENATVIVDNATYSRLKKEYAAQCEGVGVLGKKCKDAIVKEKIGKRTVYYIHDVIVRPVSEITFYDKFVGKTTRLMAITRKKNIVLGGSIKGRGENVTGLKLRRQDTDGGGNKYVMVADFLLLTHIADSGEIIATQQHFDFKK